MATVYDISSVAPSACLDLPTVRLPQDEHPQKLPGESGFQMSVKLKGHSRIRPGSCITATMA